VAYERVKPTYAKESLSLRSLSCVTKLWSLLRTESRMVKPEIASREDGKLYS
jgi:hypothetical protein